MLHKKLNVSTEDFEDSGYHSNLDVNDEAYLFAFW